MDADADNLLLVGGIMLFGWRPPPSKDVEAGYVVPVTVDSMLRVLPSAWPIVHQTDKANWIATVKLLSGKGLSKSTNCFVLLRMSLSSTLVHSSEIQASCSRLTEFFSESYYSRWGI